jgi:hypothetical protein
MGSGSPLKMMDFSSGPFKTLSDLVDHIEKRRLFAPWGSPGVQEIGAG